MNLLLALEQAAEVYSKKAEKYPLTKVLIGRENLTYAEIAKEIRMVIGWVYPALDSTSIKKVTLCRNCAHYKRFRKKEKAGIQPTVRTLCELDKTERKPEYFCANGVEREEVALDV